MLEQQFRRVAQGLGAGLQLVGLPSVLRLHLPAFGPPVLHRDLALGELGAPLPGRTTILLDHGAGPDISIGLRRETVTALGIAEASGNKHLEDTLN